MGMNIHKTLQFNHIFTPKLSSGGILTQICPCATSLNIFNGANRKNKENSIYRLCNSIWDYIKSSPVTTLNLFLYRVIHY